MSLTETIGEQIAFFSKRPLNCCARSPAFNGAPLKSHIAEIVLDMLVFPDDKHLASWAGLCPGNHQSAGKRRSGTTRNGSKWLD